MSAELYQGPCQIYMTDVFTKIVYGRFLNAVQKQSPEVFYKREHLKTSKNTFSYRTPPLAASLV